MQLLPLAPQGPLPPTPSKSPGAKRQQGLASFFKQTAKCLSCRQPMKQQAAAAASPFASPGSSVRSGGSSRGQQQPEPPPPPALCDSCQQQPDSWAQAYLGALQEEGRQWEQLCGAQAACLSCHSGGHCGPVVCENGECPALFPRLAAARALAGVEGRLERLEAHCGW